MPTSRRQFLKSTFGSIFLITAGSTLQSFIPDRFFLPDENQVGLRFAIASDGHYGQPQTDFVSFHSNIAQWLNREGKERGLDFVFINGDIFHNDPAYLPKVKAAWDQLEAPYYVSRGNHDRTDESNWSKIWGTPFDYGFQKNNTGFVVLDSSNIKGEFTGPDLDKTKFLLKEYNHTRQLFVFTHIPLVKWNKWDIERPEIINLFAGQQNLKAVFHGHDHDQDAGKEISGKYFFWDSHVGSNWGTDYHGYRIVELLKTGAILTYQINPKAGKQVNHRKL